MNINNYIVEVTGELKAEGFNINRSHWNIAIEMPDKTKYITLPINGYGISTSGDYRNYKYHKESRKYYSHNINPYTGIPMQSKLASVTVFDKSTTKADGLSTLLMILGEDKGYKFAEKHNIIALFIINKNNKVFITMTTCFKNIFKKIKIL